MLGARAVETEHVLLGVLRDSKGITGDLLVHVQMDFYLARGEISSRTSAHHPISTSVEIPFSADTKRILQYAAEEADRLGHRHIGPEHLLLGMLREENSVAGRMLIGNGVDLRVARGEVARLTNAS